MTGGAKDAILSWAVVLAWVLPGALAADVVRLKDGRIYRNVKAIQQEQHLLVIQESGKTLLLKATDVAGIAVRQVRWQRAPGQRVIEGIVERRVQERLAILKREAKTEPPQGAPKAEKESESGQQPEPGAAPAGQGRTALPRKKGQDPEAPMGPADRTPAGPKREAAPATGLEIPWSSLLMPGWGQWRSGRRTEGAGLLAGAAGLAVLYYHSGRQWRTARGQYDNAVLLGALAFLEPRAAVPLTLQSRILGADASVRMNSWGGRADVASFLFGLLYGYNAYDAYRVRQSGPVAVPALLEVAVIPPTVRSGSALLVGFSWSF